MLMEGVGHRFQSVTLECIEKMSRDELQEWLEFRGFAVYDDESTTLLRETALEDCDGSN